MIFTPKDSTDYTTVTGSVSVQTISPDFMIAVSGSNSTQTVIPGDSVSYNFTLTPASGSFPYAVTYSLSGLPSGATATLSPSSIASGSAATTVKLTVQTASASARVEQRSITGRYAPLVLALLLLPLAGTRRMRKQARRWPALLLVLGAAAIFVTGCGGGYFAQQQQSYTVTVTATSGSLQHSTTVTLEVQ